MAGRSRSVGEKGTASFRRKLAAGEALMAVAVPAGPTRGIAPLASIFDDAQLEIAVLAQWNEDLVFRLRTRAIDLELRPPAVRLRGVFLNGASETLTVAGAVRENRFVVEAAAPAGRRSRVLPLSPQWGWSLLLPFDYAFGPEVGWLSALWIGCWLLPVDFWLGGGDVNPILAAALTIVLLALGLVATPALLQEPGSLPEWGAGLASAVSGWGLARRARASARPPAQQAQAL